MRLLIKTILFTCLISACGNQQQPAEPEAEAKKEKVAITSGSKIKGVESRSKMKVTYSTYKLNDIEIVLKQVQPQESPNASSCSATLYIRKKLTKTDSLSFQQIEAVGGAYGFTTPTKVMDHMVLTKHGDYDGRTIVINDNGDIFDIAGGMVYLDSNLLFSFYESDVPGIAIFDLSTDSLILSKLELETYPISVSKTADERFIIKGIGMISNEDELWEFIPEPADIIRLPEEKAPKDEGSDIPELDLGEEASCICK